MARSWAELLGDSEGPQEDEAERRGFFGRLRESLGEVPAGARRADRRRGVRPRATTRRGSGSRRRSSRRTSASARPPSSCGGSRRGRTLDRPRHGARRGDRPAPRRAADARRRRTAGGDPRRRRQRHRQDDDDRQARAEAAGARPRRSRVGAADTFRAAAEEQLEIWARRSGANFVGGERGGDPAAVAYDAVGAGGDVVIVDTAGRLHTQTNLMDELAEGPPRDRGSPRRRAARDAARRRRDDGAERRSSRRASSTRPSASPASRSRSSTARRRAGSPSRSPTSSACR